MTPARIGAKVDPPGHVPTAIRAEPAELDEEVAELVERAEGSTAHSHERRAERPRLRRRARLRDAAIAAAGCLGAAALALIAMRGIDAGGVPLIAAKRATAVHGGGIVHPEPGGPQRDGGAGAGGRATATVVPVADGLDAAHRFASSREGFVSFAVVDTTGHEHGHAASTRYVSASVVKAMLLAAELRRLAAADLPLDPATQDTLHAMVTYSDNDAADAIYGRVGDAGLYDIARRAEMGGFEVSGYWANAQITAIGMARMFARLPEMFPSRHREYGLGLLGSVVPAQRWGIPAAARDEWLVRFKGGWRSTDRGQLVHQAAELHEGDTRLSLAVLTDGQPSQAYGIETVHGIASRLLSSPPPLRRGGGPRRGL
jgi:Beta-lactamase enzyme family